MKEMANCMMCGVLVDQFLTAIFLIARKNWDILKEKKKRLELHRVIVVHIDKKLLLLFLSIKKTKGVLVKPVMYAIFDLVSKFFFKKRTVSTNTN